MDYKDFFLDQLVTPEDLDSTEQYRVDEIRKNNLRQLLYPVGSQGVATVLGGVLSTPVDIDGSLDLNSLLAVKESTTRIRVTAGAAIMPDGTPIKLDSDVIINLEDETDQLSWPANGSGSIRYVVLTYTTIPSEPKLDRSGVSHPTKQSAVYKIVVTGVGPILSTGVILAFFVQGAGFTISGDLTDARSYVRRANSADAIYIDPNNNSLPTVKTVHDFTQLTGGGTPTLNNPHGLTFDDIQGSGAKDHFDDSHTPGIVFIDGTPDDSWKPIYGTNEVSFTAPTGNAQIIIGGKRYTNALNPLSAATIESVIGGGSTGFLIARVSGNSAVSAVITSSDYISQYASLGKDYCVLGTTAIDPPTHTIDAVYDLRDIKTLTIPDIRIDLDESISNPATTLTSIDSAGLLKNLQRIRYQIKAITGEINWKTAPSRTLDNLQPSTLSADLAEDSTNDPSNSGSSIGNILPAGSTLKDNLDRIRHQIGMIINGNGVSWDDDVNLFGSLYTAAVDRANLDGTKSPSYTISKDPLNSSTPELTSLYFRGYHTPGGTTNGLLQYSAANKDFTLTTDGVEAKLNLGELNAGPITVRDDTNSKLHELVPTNQLLAFNYNNTSGAYSDIGIRALELHDTTGNQKLQTNLLDDGSLGIRLELRDLTNAGRYANARMGILFLNDEATTNYTALSYKNSVAQIDSRYYTVGVVNGIGGDNDAVLQFGTNLWDAGSQAAGFSIVNNNTFGFSLWTNFNHGDPSDIATTNYQNKAAALALGKVVWQDPTSANTVELSYADVVAIKANAGI